MRLDQNKLRCYSRETSIILSAIPLSVYLDRIIFDGEDEINIEPREDPMVGNHKLRIFLDKSIEPPMIYVHIDGKFAAQYGYFDEKFAKRSELEL
jgi:hypothetical protein